MDRLILDRRRLFCPFESLTFPVPGSPSNQTAEVPVFPWNEVSHSVILELVELRDEKPTLVRQSAPRLGTGAGPQASEYDEFATIRV
jgi:hypothetical protein